VVIWRKELWAGSGGAGRHRGGLGQVVEVGGRFGDSFEVLAMYERVANPARGRDGGQDGAAGTVSLASGAPLRAKGLQRIPAGDRLVLKVPGGAGLGEPAERAADDLARDVEAGLVSPGAASSLADF
jgi:N-methylhydantoinase B